MQVLTAPLFLTKQNTPAWMMSSWPPPQNSLSVLCDTSNTQHAHACTTPQVCG